MSVNPYTLCTTSTPDDAVTEPVESGWYVYNKWGWWGPFTHDEAVHFLPGVFGDEWVVFYDDYDGELRLAGTGDTVTFTPKGGRIALGERIDFIDGWLLLDAYRRTYWAPEMAA